MEFTKTFPDRQRLVMFEEKLYRSEDEHLCLCSTQSSLITVDEGGDEIQRVPRSSLRGQIRSAHFWVHYLGAADSRLRQKQHTPFHSLATRHTG